MSHWNSLQAWRCSPLGQGINLWLVPSKYTQICVISKQIPSWPEHQIFPHSWQKYFETSDQEIVELFMGLVSAVMFIPTPRFCTRWHIPDMSMKSKLWHFLGFNFWFSNPRCFEEHMKMRLLHTLFIVGCSVFRQLGFSQMNTSEK